MSRQFGILTTSAGVSSVVIQSLQIGNSIETAQAMDELGNITDINGYEPLTISLSPRGVGGGPIVGLPFFLNFLPVNGFAGSNGFCLAGGFITSLIAGTFGFQPRKRA